MPAPGTAPAAAVLQALSPHFSPPNLPPSRTRRPALTVWCEADAGRASGRGNDRLKIGSPIVIVEAPPTLKTAASMPSLRVNAGEVKAGDVGRILARKPKDVWAVRLAIGTYLLDGKHFKPLVVDEADESSSE